MGNFLKIFNDLYDTSVIIVICVLFWKIMPTDFFYPLYM